MVVPTAQYESGLARIHMHTVHRLLKGQRSQASVLDDPVQVGEGADVQIGGKSVKLPHEAAAV